MTVRFYSAEMENFFRPVVNRMKDELHEATSESASEVCLKFPLLRNTIIVVLL